MEQIGEIINRNMGNYPKPIQNQTNYTSNDVDDIVELTIAEKLSKFGLSTLEHTFDTYRLVNQNTNTALVAMQLLSAGESDRQMVALYGTTGCGKTHLIEATIIAWAKRGLYARYQTFSDVARSLKKALRKGGEYYDALFDRLKDAERLIIDDIGMGTTESRFEIADLEDLIDLRYRKRFYPDLQMVTIIATNKDINELPDRIVSRFCDPEVGQVLYLGDKDYRRRQR